MGTLDPVVLCRRRSVADEWFGRALRRGEPRAALGGWFLLAAGVLHDHPVWPDGWVSGRWPGGHGAVRFIQDTGDTDVNAARNTRAPTWSVWAGHA